RPQSRRAPRPSWRQRPCSPCSSWRSCWPSTLSDRYDLAQRDNTGSNPMRKSTKQVVFGVGGFWLVFGGAALIADGVPSNDRDSHADRACLAFHKLAVDHRSEEHTSELQ